MSGEVCVLRPFKLIALVCVCVAVGLDGVALVSPAWVTSEHHSLSLWEACRLSADVWNCQSALTTDWQVATLVLLLTGASLTLVSFFISLILFCRKTLKRYYHIIAILLFAAVVLQVCALILYPIKFIDGNTLQTYHEFSWGYGLGWGATIFMLGGAILYCLRTDTFEDIYY